MNVAEAIPINDVAMVRAVVEVNEEECREAYMQRCRMRMYRAQTGDMMQDAPFTVTVNGRDCAAHFMCEADDYSLGSTTIVARYHSDTTDGGEWFSLMIIDHQWKNFKPRQMVRQRETGVTMGLHIDARRLLNTDT